MCRLPPPRGSCEDRRVQQFVLLKSQRLVKLGGGCGTSWEERPLTPLCVFACTVCYVRAQSEWERDRQGAPALTRYLFFAAVFELIGSFPVHLGASVCLCVHSNTPVCSLPRESPATIPRSPQLQHFCHV